MLLKATQFVVFIMLVVCASSIHAADLALLRNGYEIRHKARESVGECTRLYLNADRTGGYVEIKSDQIVAFEEDESVGGSPALSSSKPDSDILKQTVNVQAAIAAASKTHAIDPDLIASVIHAESSFSIRAVSRKGAQGLMQLMPETASALGVNDSFDPGANVDGGMRYLRELLLRYNDDLQKALAAYNAGPRRVDQYKGVPPYRETRQYAARVIRDFNAKKVAARVAARARASSSSQRRLE